MKHSNRQLEREEEYARQNREYLEEKRAQLRSLRSADREEAIPKKVGFNKNFYCCAFFIVLLGVAGFIIYYFAANIKSSVYNDYIDKKGQIEKYLPSNKDELQQNINENTKIVDKTKEQIDDLQKKYQAAEEQYKKIKALYDQGKEQYDRVKSAYDEVEKIKKDLGI